MPDPISAAVATLASSINIVKGLIDVHTQIKQSELKAKLLDLMEALVEARKESFELARKVEELTSLLDAKAAMAFDVRAYFIDKDGGREGPFCPACWDGSRKQIRMTPRVFGSYRGMPGLQIQVQRHAAD